LERRENAVHRLRRGVARAREISSRRAGIASEHAEHCVLRAVQAVGRQRRVERTAQRIRRLPEQIPDVPVGAAVALSDRGHRHVAENIRDMTTYQVPDIMRAMTTTQPTLRIQPTLRDHCDDLRARHHGDRPLVLPNAWDAASARAVVDAGYPVVATTSG